MCYEHRRAAWAAEHARDHKARRRFHALWIATGIASMARAGRPHVNLLSAPPPAAPAESGAVHLKVVAAFVPATAKAPAASGWAGEAHTVQADRTAPRLAAHGAVPARATHPALTQHVAERHTQQVAQQGALAAWLTYAEQLAQRGSRVVLTVYSATTERDLRQPLRDERRRRACKHEALRLRNCRKLESLRQRFGERVTVRVSAGAAPLRLLAQAQRAATSKDVRARVTLAGEASRSVSLWDESRVWDPGD